MGRSFAEVKATAETEKTSVRDAVMTLAMQHVVEVMNDRRMYS